MKRSTERLISLVIALVLLLASVIIYFDLIQGSYGDVQNIRAEIISNQNTLNTQKQTISQIQSLLSDYRNQTNFSQQLSTALPLTADSAGALGQLSGLAQTNHLVISSVSATTRSNITVVPKASASLIKPVGVLEFKARLSGRYEDIRTFLFSIETNYRLFDAQQINLSPAADPKTDAYNLDLTVDTYYQTN
ncbi:MAG: type 4a pilus biogenesis protein PilO [Patescibacteria group bacterium]|nr:type 4a pilus biogenesis protein PilO [Patescibacteria group bacterium]